MIVAGDRVRIVLQHSMLDGVCATVLRCDFIYTDTRTSRTTTRVQFDNGGVDYVWADLLVKINSIMLPAGDKRCKCDTITSNKSGRCCSCQ